MPSPSSSTTERRIALVQKDSLFRPIPPRQGAPAGAVWYVPTGGRLTFRLHASGLVPHRRYELDLTVDGVTYTMASRPASAEGTVAIDTSLDRFAEGACVGANYHPPRPIAGRHRLQFALKNDGSPRSGTMAGDSATRARWAGGADLPCAGNGDGNYSYVLYEAEVAEFEGRRGAREESAGSPAARERVHRAGPLRSGAVGLEVAPSSDRGSRARSSTRVPMS